VGTPAPPVDRQKSCGCRKICSQRVKETRYGDGSKSEVLHSFPNKRRHKLGDVC